MMHSPTPKPWRARAAGLENLSVVEAEELRAKLTPNLPWGSRRPSSRTSTTDVQPPRSSRASSLTRSSRSPRRVYARAMAAHATSTSSSTRPASNQPNVPHRDLGHGSDRQKLDEAWSDDPAAYLGVVTSGFPNLFMLYGPNTNNGSILQMLEYQAEFVVRFVQLIEKEELSWVDLRPEAQAYFNHKLQSVLDSVGVWRPEDDGYYRGRSGRIVTQWPHTMDDYAQQLRELSLVAFEYARR